MRTRVYVDGFNLLATDADADSDAKSSAANDGKYSEEGT